MALIATFLSRLLADEFKAWNPHIVQHLIQYAVSRLPEGQRSRYEEEWASHINEIPGEIGKLFTATGFLFATRRMLATDHERTVVLSQNSQDYMTLGLLPEHRAPWEPFALGYSVLALVFAFLIICALHGLL